MHSVQYAEFDDSDYESDFDDIDESDDLVIVMPEMLRAEIEAHNAWESDEACAQRAQEAKAALAACEDRIDRGLATFVEVGDALEVIRVSALYKVAGYSTFEKYCGTRWGFSRTRAYQLISAASVLHALSTRVDTDDQLPRNEAQCRPLAALISKDAQADCWKRALKRRGLLFPDARGPTYADVAAAVAEYRDERSSPSPAVDQEPERTCPTCGRRWPKGQHKIKKHPADGRQRSGAISPRRHGASKWRQT